MSNTTVTKQTYSISKIKKLIDLNGDMTNFRIHFTIASPEGKTFEALIVDQSTLDNMEPEYKTVPGSMSGDIEATKNVYQNYFIILRSQLPMTVEVELETTALPDYIESKEVQPMGPQPRPTTTTFSRAPILSLKSNHIYIAIGGVGVLLVLIYLYKKYKLKNPTVEGVEVGPKHSLLKKLEETLKAST